MQKQRTMIGVTALAFSALLAGMGGEYWLNNATAYAASSTPAVVANRTPPGAASLVASQQELADLYNKVSPAVVNIQVELKPSEPIEQMPRSPFNFPFPFPFGPQGSPNGEGTQPWTPMAEGSGFIYDNQGHIVTNNHVVADATKIVVNFANGLWAKAELVARDPQADLAVLTVTPPKGMTLQPLQLADDNVLQVGYSVAAIGSPFDLAETLTTGIVSAIGRSFPTGDSNGPAYALPDVIQTDAAINPGNSGGPLLDMNGDVVGVNFAINSPVRANSGVGFAIPVSVVRKGVPVLIEKGQYDYAYLGLGGQTINALVADEKQLDNSVQGVYVGSVTQGGPAAKAGVQTDDIVTAIDNQPVHSFEDLLSYLFNSTKPEQKVTLHIVRAGTAKHLEVTLGMRPGEQLEQANSGAEQLLPANKAIAVAKQAVHDAGLLESAGSISARRVMVNGEPAWEVKLSGDGKSAIVMVDAQSGEVIELTLQK